LGWEEEVEHVRWEEDLEVAGLEETSDGEQDSVKEDDDEEEEEGVRLDDGGGE
jgi:hypothetical protein